MNQLEESKKGFLLTTSVLAEIWQVGKRTKRVEWNKITIQEEVNGVAEADFIIDIHHDAAIFGIELTTSKCVCVCVCVCMCVCERERERERELSNVYKGFHLIHVHICYDRSSLVRVE